MGEFFKPWRRKLGVVTLVMACVFMVGWVRSQNIWVIGSGSSRSGEHCFYFNPVGYGWTIQEQLGSFPPVKTNHQRKSLEWRISKVTSLQLKGLAEEMPIYRGLLNWRWGGFIIRLQQTFGIPQVRFTEWRIPHWSIVIPLTLVSAFLLLSKPQKASQKKPIEPIAEKVE